MKEGRNIQIIEWKDLDKKRFYGAGLIFSGALRFTIYPTNLVKTRLQAQEGKTAYKGLFDAFKQIARAEGLRGFYKGFPISLLQVFSAQIYITTYELSKQSLFSNQPLSVQHMLGGFMAAAVSQTILVPVDVVSQHQQVMGASHKMTTIDLKNGKSAQMQQHPVAAAKKQNLVGQSIRISKQILKSEGLPGLYRGYLISLLTYGTNSALYWAFYYLYSELIEEILPKSDNKFREPLRIVSSGFMGSVTSVVLTNPLDVVRTRYQLQVKNIGEGASARNTFTSLMATEGFAGFRRGLTARILSSGFNSCVIILTYEYLKKFSAKSKITEHESQKRSKLDDLDANVAVAAESCL